MNNFFKHNKVALVMLALAFIAICVCAYMGNADSQIDKLPR